MQLTTGSKGITRKKPKTKFASIIQTVFIFLLKETIQTVIINKQFKMYWRFKFQQKISACP